MRSIQLPDRSRSLQGASACVAACGARRAIDFERRDARGASASTSCSTCSARGSSRMHQPPQGYLAPGADAVAQAKAVPSSRRWSASSRSRSISRTRRRSVRTAARSKTGCNQCIDICSTRRSAPTAISRGRAAPVHGVRRMRDSVSVGRDDYAYPAVPDPARGCARCWRRTPKPAGATRASCCTRRTPRRIARPRATRTRTAGAGHSVEVHHIASMGIDLWLAALA